MQSSLRENSASEHTSPQEDWLLDVQGPLQSKNTGTLGQKLLRILRQLQQRVNRRQGPAEC